MLWLKLFYSLIVFLFFQTIFSLFGSNILFTFVGLFWFVMVFVLFMLVIFGLMIWMFTFSFIMKSISDNIKQCPFNKEMNITKSVNNGSHNPNYHRRLKIVCIQFRVITHTIVDFLETDIESDDIGECRPK